MGECHECAFWKQLDDLGGQCRRYAPQPKTSESSDDEPYSQVWWPQTTFDDWCGEFQQRKPEILDSPFLVLDLGILGNKACYRMGLATVGDVTSKTADDFLTVKNFGMTSLNKVRSSLALHGLHLKGDIS